MAKVRVLKRGRATRSVSGRNNCRQTGGAPQLLVAERAEAAVGAWKVGHHAVALGRRRVRAVMGTGVADHQFVLESE